MIRKEPAVGKKALTPRLVEMPWYQRLNLINITVLIFLVGVIYSFGVLRGSGREINYLDSLFIFVGRFFPPDFSILDQIRASLLETIQIAITATFFSIILSFILAIGAAQNIAPGWLVTIIRMVLNLVRTLPSLIWALLAVVVVGANPLAGVIGLTFYSVGYLGKFFSEAFESVDLEVARSLQTIGAGRLQAFQYGLWPNAKPLVLSYSLWITLSSGPSGAFPARAVKRPSTTSMPLESVIMYIPRLGRSRVGRDNAPLSPEPFSRSPS